MKKVLFFSAIAAAALTGCSSDEFVGGQPQVEPTGEEMAIAFSGKSNLITRATAIGSDAATKLNNAFVVYGTKHVTGAEDKTATNDEVVYNQYQVAYTANTAGTTVSNTHNWEYVGKTAYQSGLTQTIKYWDLSAANGYTFYAFSSSNISYPADPADLVSVTKTTAAAGATDTKYDKGYTVTIKNGASVDNLYYADRVEVPKAQYGDPVVFTFRNMGSRVRVGFYEQVPGYSVKIDKFYFDEDASAAVTTYAAMTDESTTNFVAAMQNVKVGAASNALNVTYYSDADGDVKNQVKVTNTTVAYDYTLKLGTGITAATALGTSPATATWDNGGAYTTVYPFEANTNPMIVRVDYTLTSDDGDANAEVIHVKNARVMVPLQYCQWKSNYAYTYLFKITDQTNGTTGNVPTDPDDPTSGDKEGLFPITFDAVVINATDGIQETISTLSTNSVTTYVEGKVSSDYQNGEDIYAVVTNPVTKQNVAPTAIGNGDTEAQVYLIGGANAAKATEADVYANLTGIKNAITLTAVTPAASLQQYVPATDGTNYDFGAKGAVKFTPAAAGKYAYVYATEAYVAPTYASVASEAYDQSVTYYFKTTGDVYSAASGLSAENWETYKSQLYKQTAAGTAGDYTVKVITVQ